MYFYPVDMLKTDTLTWNCVKMLILIICGSVRVYLRVSFCYEVVSNNVAVGC